jgi:hypothetical protein
MPRTLPDSSGCSPNANVKGRSAMSPAELIARVQRMLMSPNTEWDSIDGEGADVAKIYQSYILPLVGLSAIAQFLAVLIVGGGFVLALKAAVFSFVLGAAMVYVVALIIDGLAPQFGAKSEFGQAFKVAAYSPTASWVGGIFVIIPFLGGLIALIGALYSLYLLYLGLPKLMKPAADKAMIYTLAVIGVMIVIGIVVAFVVMPFVITIG